MKKKVLSALLSTMMLVSLLGTTSLAAASDGELGNISESGATVSGNSGIENPTYKIVIPTGYTFAIDPFEQGGQTGSQIKSDDFEIINKSNVAVRVNVAVSLTPAVSRDIVIKSTAADVTETNTDRLIYMAAEVPSAVTETPAAAAAFANPALYQINGAGPLYSSSSATDGSNTATAYSATDVVDITKVAGNYTNSAKVVLGTENTDLLFALAKAEYQDYYAAYGDTQRAGTQFKAMAAGTAGSTVFRFSGKVNSKADWAANDIVANAAYTFLGLSDTNYNALIAKQVTDSHAYVVEETAPVFSSTEVGVISYVDGDGDLAFASLEKIEANFEGTIYEFKDQVTVDTSAKTLTVASAFLAGWASKSENPTATITYKNVGGQNVTTTVVLRAY